MKKWIFLLGILFLFNAGLSPVVFAENASKPYKLCALKQGGTVSVYRDPTVHSGSICKLSAKSRGIIKRKDHRIYRHSKWQKISWQSKTGWIKNGCFKLEGQPKKPNKSKKPRKSH